MARVGRIRGWPVVMGMVWVEEYGMDNEHEVSVEV